MKKLHILLISLLVFTACSKENTDLVLPIPLADRPLQLVFDEEESGVPEDDDEIELVFTFVDQYDPTGQSLEGLKLPHTANLRVTVAFSDNEGFAEWSDYFTGIEAFYEIDDCITSLDQNISLNPTLDLVNGRASFDIPAGIAEVILVLETDPTDFDNAAIDEDRGFKVNIVEMTGEGANTRVKYLQDQAWEVIILDDETIYGKWAFDGSVSADLDNLKDIFSLINEDFESLSTTDIDEVELEVELDKVTLKIVLTETETITECGVTEVVNKEIEVDMDIEDLSDLLDGEIELLTEVEADNGSITEYTIKAVFTVVSGVMTMTMEIEDGDDTIERTFQFTK